MHRALAVLAAQGLVLAALAVMWVQKARIGRPAYVSELGGAGEPTAPAFNLALLALGLGVVLTAAAGRHPASRVAWLGRWPIGWTLAACGLAFVVASRVPCSAGCPVPGSAAFAANDVVHLTSAIAGFAIACLAMLQSATSGGGRALRAASWAAAALVATIAGAGGLLALEGTYAAQGAQLEFVATSIAVLWFVPYGASVLRRPQPAVSVPST